MIDEPTPFIDYWNAVDASAEVDSPVEKGGPDSHIFELGLAWSIIKNEWASMN